jgi:hypothetical protein
MSLSLALSLSELSKEELVKVGEKRRDRIFEAGNMRTANERAN